MEEPLTAAYHLTLRSELGNLIRISRIYGHGALYDASASSQTFGTIDEEIINPIDFDDIDAANLTKEIANITHKRIQGYEEFTSKCPESVNRADLARGGG